MTAFLDGLVADLTQFCIFSIKSTLDTTSDDPQQQPEFVDSLVQQVEDASCPGEPTLCGGRGTCTEGHCVCDSGRPKRVSFQVPASFRRPRTNLSNSDLFVSVPVSLDRLCGTGWLDSRVDAVLGCRRTRVQIAAATRSGNSLRQTVRTRCASVHQAAKLAESNGSLPPGL